MRTVLLVLVGVLVAMTAAAAAADSLTQIALFSDVHYDPLYGTASGFRCTSSSAKDLGQKGCDSPLALVERTVADISAQAFSLTVYCGDWQRHQFDKSSLPTSAIFSNLSEMFAKIETDGNFSDPAFAGAFGNNDVVPDYYYSQTEKKSQEELEERVEAMQLEGLLSSGESDRMKTCGFYTHETPEVNIIVLHTLLWAHTLTPPLSSIEMDPCGQFAFLREQLKLTAQSGKRAMIVGHIPPGLDVYKVLSKGSFTAESSDMYWKLEYQSTYDDIIKNYAATVNIQLFGHTHRLAVLTMSTNGVLGLIVPSVSPVFGNIPSYVIGSFDNMEVKDITIRYLTSEGTFTTGVGLRSVLDLPSNFTSFSAIAKAVRQLALNDTVWDNYLKMFGESEKVLMLFPGSTCDASCRRIVVCGMLENRYSDIKDCVLSLRTELEELTPSNNTKQEMDTWLIALVIILSFVVVFVSVVMALAAFTHQGKFRISDLGSCSWWTALITSP